MKDLTKTIALIAITFSLCLTTVIAQENYEPNDPNVRVEYKQYESFDLGNLEIEGRIIAPGDLSVQQRDRKRFNRNLFERFDFDPEIKEDIFHLR
jgi:hypothetical protein